MCTGVVAEEERENKGDLSTGSIYRLSHEEAPKSGLRERGGRNQRACQGVENCQQSQRAARRARSTGHKAMVAVHGGHLEIPPFLPFFLGTAELPVPALGV